MLDRSHFRERFFKLSHYPNLSAPALSDLFTKWTHPASHVQKGVIYEHVIRYTFTA